MKRLFSILVAVILMFSLVACQHQNPSDVTPSETSTEAMKVGFIYLHDEQSTYDLNFLRAAQEACALAGVECINKVNIPEGGECYEAAMELADLGCDIVFADSFGHEDYMIQAARECPEVQFCHATGTQAHTANLPNFHNAFAAIYEGRFLAGVAAGLKLNEMIEQDTITPEEAIIGYIGAYPYAEVISGYTSFFLGARYMCPTATMQVVFTNSWYDETLEKEGANRLIQNGCVLISQHADSMGAPSACENAGIPNISYNGSTIEAAPNTFIISTRINWVPYFLYMIDCVKNNVPINTDWVGTIDNGAVEMTEVNEAVAAAGTEFTIESIKNLFATKTLNVFDINTFTVNGKNLQEYMADVDADADFTPDTNVIIDGYFHESEFRSAPYFDLLIDGITLLDA